MNDSRGAEQQGQQPPKEAARKAEKQPEKPKEASKEKQQGKTRRKEIIGNATMAVYLEGLRDKLKERPIAQWTEKELKTEFARFVDVEQTFLAKARTLLEREGIQRAGRVYRMTVSHMIDEVAKNPQRTSNAGILKVFIQEIIKPSLSASKDQTPTGEDNPLTMQKYVGEFISKIAVKPLGEWKAGEVIDQSLALKDAEITQLDKAQTHEERKQIILEVKLYRKALKDALDHAYTKEATPKEDKVSVSGGFISVPESLEKEMGQRYIEAPDDDSALREKTEEFMEKIEQKPLPEWNTKDLVEQYADIWNIRNAMTKSSASSREEQAQEPLIGVLEQEAKKRIESGALPEKAWESEVEKLITVHVADKEVKGMGPGTPHIPTPVDTPTAKEFVAQFEGDKHTPAGQNEALTKLLENYRRDEAALGSPDTWIDSKKVQYYAAAFGLLNRVMKARESAMRQNRAPSMIIDSYVDYLQAEVRKRLARGVITQQEQRDLDEKIEHVAGKIIAPLESLREDTRQPERLEVGGETVYTDPNPDDRSQMYRDVERSRRLAQQDERPAEVIVQDLANTIAASANLRDVANAYRDLQMYARLMSRSKASFSLAQRALLENVTSLNTSSERDISVFKDLAARFMRDMEVPTIIQDLQKQKRERGMYEKHESLEEVVQDLMDSEIDEWRTEKQLINERGEIQMHNFLAWIQDRVIYEHEFTPDKPIDLFRQIYIATPFRQISLGELISPGTGYFRKEIEHPVLDPRTGKQVLGKKDLMYDRIRDYITQQVWLFNNLHSHDAQYRAIMGNDEELRKVKAEIHRENIYTKNRERLLFLLKSIRTDNDSELALLHPDIKMKDQPQGAIGKAMRRSIAAYYHAGEAVNLRGGANTDNLFSDVLSFGNDGAGLDTFYSSIIRQRLERMLREDSDENTRIQYEQIAADFKRNHSGVDSAYILNYAEGQRLFALAQQKLHIADRGGIGINVAQEFAANKHQLALNLLAQGGWDSENQLNLFVTRKSDYEFYELYRTAIRESVAIAEGISIKDAQYAESMAFSTVYWSGINARNDTNVEASDRQTTVLNTDIYRKKQFDYRIGIAGDRDTLGGPKRIVLDFWEGLSVRKVGDKTFDKTLLEFIQGGEGDEINFNNFYNFDFQGAAETNYFENHYMNGFSFYDFLMKTHGFQMDQWVKLDQYGRVVVDKEKADQIFKPLYKNLRYTYDLGQALLGKKVRTWEKEYTVNKEGAVKSELVYKSLTIDEILFGEEVRNLRMHDRPNFTDSQKRDFRARNVLAYLIGKEMLAHRKWDSDVTRWGFEQMEHVEGYLKNLEMQVIEETIEKGKRKGEHDIRVVSRFFSDHEWEQIAKMGHSTFWELMREILLTNGLMALVGGAWETGEEFVEQVAPLKDGGGKRH